MKAKSKSVIKSIRFRSDLVIKIQKQADIENRTFTNMVETILITSLKNGS